MSASISPTTPTPVEPAWREFVRSPLVPVALTVSVGLIADRYFDVPLAAELVGCALGILAWLLSRWQKSGAAVVWLWVAAGALAGAAWAAVAIVAGLAAAVVAAAGAGGAVAGALAPFAPVSKVASSAPTAMTSPGLPLMLSTRPLTGEGTSTTALSVDISTSG